MKIIIDTNILISAALKGGKAKIIIAYIISSTEYQWLVSPEIMDEYKNVLNRPKFRLSETQKREWFEIIDLATILVEVNVSINFPRDQKDAKFLALCISSEANYFITGDKDFEDIIDLELTQIISASKFLELIQ
jgi:putative PIN family toxin of toxin-antitoxin system